jgi:hypothetical protein
MKLIEKVLARCTDCGGCLVWNQNRHAKCVTPSVCDGAKRISARRVAYEHFHGPIPEGKVITSACETKLCMLHQKAVTRGELASKVATTGAFARPARCAKIAAAQRASKSRLTLEQVEDIRYGPGSLSEAAKRHGITKSGAASIRQHRTWKDYSNPFARLGA